MRKFARHVIALFVIWSFLSIARGDVRLPPLFSDNMVLQRDGATPIWGTASPDEKITVKLNGQTAAAVANAQGEWTAVFNKLIAGGPYELVVAGASGQPVTLHNVLVGDVWLCSGQSNMTMPIAGLKDSDPEVVSSANDPAIRCYTAGTNPSAVPLSRFTGAPPAAVNAAATGGDLAPAGQSGKWEITTPRTVMGFTAMGYYFARELRKELNVPIGIVHVSWGASSAEAWMSREALGAIDLGAAVDAQVNRWSDAATLAETALREQAVWQAQFGRQDPGNKGFEQGWAAPDYAAADWTAMNTLGDWSSLGMPDGGMVWARKEIELPPAVAGKELTLNLGNFQNAGDKFGSVTGTVYFNGHEIGLLGHKLAHLYSTSEDQVVTIPGAEVSSGCNVVVLRVVTQSSKGAEFGISKHFLDGRVDPQAYASPWKVKVEATLPPLPASAADSQPPVPPIPATVQISTLLYNGMLSPVVGYGIRGYLWDQGTANIYDSKGTLPEKDRALAHRHVLAKLIEDWRACWHNAALPFYFVQHPNFGKIPAGPARSQTAELRDSQTWVWQHTAHTGMAVATDVIHGDEIHYKNKRLVAHRLVLLALAGTYGRNVEASGPVYTGMTVEGGKIRLKFSHLGGGLVAKEGPLKTFAIAGKDQKFAWAEAMIEGDTIVVSSTSVPAPMAVRYAWSDNPLSANLYNKQDLPAGPFRTDDWYKK